MNKVDKFHLELLLKPLILEYLIPECIINKFDETTWGIYLQVFDDKWVGVTIKETVSYDILKIQLADLKHAIDKAIKEETLCKIK